MINPNAIKSLFKPRKFETFDFQKFLEVTGLTKKKWYKITVEDECSKSIDESCINTDCQYNHFALHKHELYVEVLQEIQAERKAIEERTKRDYERIYGKPYVE